MEESEHNPSAQNQDTIQVLWDFFVSAENKSYEKSVWFDAFLAEFLAQIKDGKEAKDILSTSNGEISTLISCELLSDVHEICSTPAVDGEELATLRSHLLSGRGWRCLAVLQCLGMQDVSCGQELASLLISLYAVGAEAMDKGGTINPYIQSKKTDPEIDAICKPRLRLRNKSRKSSEGSTSGSQRNNSNISFRGRMAHAVPTTESSKKDEESSESDKDCNGTSHLRSSLKIRLDPMDFDYFTSVIRSDDDSPLNSPSYTPIRRKKKTDKVTPEDFQNSRIKDVFNHEINCYQFRLLVVELLEGLTISESIGHSNGTHQSVSVQTMNFSLENLCSMQFGSLPLNEITSVQIAKLKSALSRLLLCSLDKILIQPEVTTTAVQKGILPVMLRLSEDTVRKLTPDVLKSIVDGEELMFIQEFVYGIIYGIITVIHCLLLQHSTSDKMNQFLILFHLFSDCLNGRLIDKTVLNILSFTIDDPRISVDRSKRLIVLISQLIIALKKIRSKIIHVRECKRNRHKHCMSLMPMHHHDNLFGKIFTTSILPSCMEQNCSVSALCMMLTRFLSDNVDNELVVRTMQVMMSCGTCCCFPPFLLIPKLLKIIVNGDQRMRTLGLVLLERTCYRQMGALDEQKTCELCVKNTKFPGTVDDVEPASKNNSMSDVSISSYISNSSETFKSSKNKWSCFESFRDILLASDPNISCMIGTHLLRIVPKFSLAVQHEILFTVFYPVFITVKQRLQSENNIDRFLLTTCLSAFTNLLGRVRFIEQFIELKVLDHIIDLLAEQCFMKLCCTIVEMVIIVQVWRLECATKKNDPSILNNRAVTELGILLENVKTLSARYLLRDDNGDSETDLVFESSRDSLVFKSEKQFDSYCSLVENLNTLWKTCANLSLYSPQVRLFFSGPETSQLAKSVLLEQLLARIEKAVVIEGETNKAKVLVTNQIHLRLLEPLLVICLVSPPIDTVKDAPVSPDTLLMDVKPKLLNIVDNRYVNIRLLCEVLLRTSLAQPSHQLILPTHKVPKVGSFMWEGADAAMSLAIALNSPDLEDPISDHDSTPDHTADEGYEADVEVPDLVLEHDENDSSSTSVSLSSSRKVPSSVENRKSHLIMHPSLCLLAVDLISHLTQRNLSSTIEELQLLDCVHCLQRLSSMCRDSLENCGRLTQHKLVSKLINNFSNVLSVSDSNLADLQVAVLELITVLAKHTIEPQELAQLIQFFTSDKPPVQYLLPPLLKLVSNNECQPSYIMRFPSPPSESKVHLQSSATHAENVAVAMRQQHVAAGLQSSWSTSTVALPINTDMGWCMWLTGFSLSLWLRLDKSPSIQWRIPPSFQNSCSSDSTQSESFSDGFSEIGLQDASYYSSNTTSDASDSTTKSKPFKQSPSNLLHVVSVGYDIMMLEIWADSIADTIIIRLMRPDGKRQEILCEATIEGQLPCGMWHHLAVNIKDTIAFRKIVIEVTLIIDGWIEVKRELSFKGLLIRKSRPSCVLLGHVGAANGSLHIGNLMMFRMPVFTKENATSLVAFGPDYTSVTQVDVGNSKPNYASVLKAKALSSGVKWEKLLGQQENILKELQEHLLLSYSAENHSSVNVYPQVISNAAGVVGSLFPQGPGFRVAAIDNRASQLLPMCVSPVFFAPASIQQYHGVTTAANIIGGLPIFLFLYARVVELQSAEESQAQALYLVLKLSQATCELYNQFLALDTYKLLRHVMSCAKTAPGLYILKAILDTCCDRPGLLTSNNKGRFNLNSQIEAILVIPDMIARVVLCAWRDWEPGGQSAVLLQLFQAVHVLLRDDHPHREFNASQLNRVSFVNSLLQFLKDRFCYEEDIPLLDPVICNTVVELIRSLMGAPPDFAHIVSIFDFLVIAHPAHATYITHVRPSFYFLLSVSKHLEGIDVKGHHSDMDFNVKAKKSRSVFSRRNDDILNHLLKANLAKPIDPSKLNRALASLQIRQNTEHYNDSIIGNVLPTDSNITSFTGSSGQGSFEDLNDWEIIREANEIQYSQKRSLDERLKQITMVDKLKAGEDEGEEEKFTSENVRETAASGTGSDRMHRRGSNMSSLGNSSMFEKHVDRDTQPIVVEGLLYLLRDVVLVLPDTMAHQVLSQVVRVEALLVMANHCNPRVRTAVVKVISAFLQRASEDEMNQFLRLKGFFQLANQLALYPATGELVDGLVAMVTGLHWLPLEEQLEDDEFGSSTLTSLRLAAIPPLLALLPRTVHDLALAHNLIHFLQRLFTKVAQSARALMESGLLEVLCKTLVAIAHTPQEPTDLCVPEQELLLSDIHGFLVAVISNAINLPGNHNMQVLTDILVQLRYVEKIERIYCGVRANCVLCLRTAQCIILNSALDLIQEKIITQQVATSRIRSSATAFLTSVLSPNYDDLLSMESVMTGTSKSSSNSDSGTSLTSSVQTGGSGGSGSKQGNRVPQSEIIDRFKMIITKATEYFIYMDPVEEPYVSVNGKDSTFICHLFTTLLSCMTAVVYRKSRPKTSWSSVVWSCRDVVRNTCAQLYAWMILPGHSNKLRMFAIQSVHNLTKAKEIMSSILLISNQIEQQFPLYLWELMYGPASPQLLPSDVTLCEELCECVQIWGILSPQAMGHKHDPWSEDVAAMLKNLQTQRKLWLKQQEPIVTRTINKMESVVKVVCEAGLAVTKRVIETQNAERKVLLELIKGSLNDHVLSVIQWKLIVQQLTHERAVWYFPKSYPRSWDLDPTEGPGRIRIRLQRCHLHLDKRFFKPEFTDKLDAVNERQPLAYLFGSEGSTLTSMSDLLIERLHTDEKIRHMSTAKIITPAYEIPGELLIGESCLYFVPSNETIKSEANSSSSEIYLQSQAWQFEDIKEVHNRRIELQERALEIFLLNGRTYLLAFQSSNERDLFSMELSQCELPHRVASDHLCDAVQLWRDGHLTNWDYLTTLNKMAGRSYNDLMQYPVMPFVLADYTSSTLDLIDPKSYRNFKKPMAVQEKKNEHHYINTYNYLKQEYTDALNITNQNQEPYHYGSHYSNSGTVLHFLVRLPPFTKMFLNYQDDNFDLPDRTFHSLHTTWRLTSRDSTTDVKELLPEFFYLPEFLTNAEGFNFGQRQNGLRVDDVGLPPWAFGDPRRFILIHRQALESDYVRENLPHWIDLVFGFKQTGKAAVDSINVFHPATYYGFDMEGITDPVDRHAWETMVRTYGQTPRQLFRAAHPMVVQSLAPKLTSPTVVEGVKGLSWGNFVGSPADKSPTVIWQQQHRTPVATLIPLLTNDVFGLAPRSALLLAYSKEKTLSLVTTGGMCVLGAALVSWGHSDGIIRAKLKKEQPPYPALRPPPSGGPITICTSVPDCNQLWIGYASGKILVYRYKFIPSRGVMEFSPDPVVLLGHPSAVLCITLNRGFSVALSGSQDGSAILWDLNRLTYVRSLPTISLPVNLTCVSETSGDLITIGHDVESGGSTVRLHTVNVILVGSFTTREQITSVCFSTAPEGVSVNVVATGMADGVIRLWSTWDLAPVGSIIASTVPFPVVSLTYSHDSQHLYAALTNGSIIIWEGSAAKGVSKTPKFLNLTTLI